MDKKHKEMVIVEHLGSMAVDGKSYPSPLSPTLSDWYVYTQDGGHSIMCVLEKDFVEGRHNCDDLVPVPVKAVLRDYEIKGDYVVVDLPYSPETGLKINEEDEEF